MIRRVVIVAVNWILGGEAPHRYEWPDREPRSIRQLLERNGYEPDPCYRSQPEGSGARRILSRPAEQASRARILSFHPRHRRRAEKARQRASGE